MQLWIKPDVKGTGELGKPGSDTTAWVDDGRLSPIDAILEDMRIAGRRSWYVVDLAYQDDPADEDVDIVSLDLGKICRVRRIVTDEGVR